MPWSPSGNPVDLVVDRAYIQARAPRENLKRIAADGRCAEDLAGPSASAGAATADGPVLDVPAVAVSQVERGSVPTDSTGLLAAQLRHVAVAVPPALPARPPHDAAFRRCTNPGLVCPQTLSYR